jgi:branched-chain amino acid transport system substrate-binding protein
MPASRHASLKEGFGLTLVRRATLRGAAIASVPLLLAVTMVVAQEAPYAAIDREAIGYAGPGREASHDLDGPTVKIGLLVPMRGPRQEEGKALLAAAQLALEDERSAPLPDGRRLELVWRDESGLWGRASSELVHLVVEDRVVALVTSPDGAAAHLAEQVGNRLGVPVVTLSADGSTTRINIPWLFRIAPCDAAQARTFAEDIYRARGFRNVVVLLEGGRDGRMAGEEFVKAARALDAPEPRILRIPANPESPAELHAEVRALNPQAIVLWAGALTAARFITEAGEEASPAHLYLSQKATQVPLDVVDAREKFAGVWVAVTTPCENIGQVEDFGTRYCAEADVPPSLPAAAAYDAIRLLAAALRKSGPNRARLRDTLAAARNFPGMSGTITFDGAGNNSAETVLAPWGKLVLRRAQR